MNTELKNENPVHRVMVDIFGEKYTVRGSANPDYIASVAEMVDSRMRELKANYGGLTRQRLAVLAALNLADELAQERRNSEMTPEPDEAIQNRTRHLISLLDEGLVGDSLDPYEG